MATLDDIVRIHQIGRVELRGWIEQRWVRPSKTDRGYDFDDVDEAIGALPESVREQVTAELRKTDS